MTSAPFLWRQVCAEVTRDTGLWMETMRALRLGPHGDVLANRRVRSRAEREQPTRMTGFEAATVRMWRGPSALAIPAGGARHGKDRCRSVKRDCADGSS
jgi:hypothetical protein